MIYGSVCSGIEAATVAWHPLGWTPVWFSEIAPFPCKVLKYYYPDIPNLGDMLKIEHHETFQKTAIDILVGGTPCQSFSTAGLRGGLTDARGNLALEFCRILAIKRPKWFVWENVPGIFSVDKGEAFRSILAGFRECGYSLSWRTMDAQFFGVPQRRRRVFVVGYLGNDWRPSASVLFEPEGMRRNTQEGGQAWQDIAGTIKGGAFGRSGDSQGNGFVPIEIARTLRSRHDSSDDGTKDNLIPIAFGGNNTQGPIEVATACPVAGGSHRMDFESETFLVFEPRVGRNGRGMPDILCPPLKAQNGQSGKGDGAPCVMWNIMPQNSGKDYKAKVATVAQPLNTVGGQAIPNQGGDLVQIAAGVRRLTPLEFERLQGFPDCYTLIPGAADSPRYEALGNSMAVPCMYWLGKRIDYYDKLFNSNG